MKAVVFDLGGTLIDYRGPFVSWPELETPGFEAAYAVLEAQGVALPSYAAFQATGFEMLPGRWQAATRGERNLRLAELLSEVLAVQGTSAEIEPLSAAATAYEDAICGHATPIAGGTAVLDTLRDRGLRLGLLSNTMFSGRAHRRDLARFGLDGYFDTMLFSADVGMWKPTPTPFLQVVDALGVDPTSAVYVGDDPGSDVVGGQAAGLRTVHIRGSGEFATPDGVVADATIDALTELPAVLAAWLNE